MQESIKCNSQQYFHQQKIDQLSNNQKQSQIHKSMISNSRIIQNLIEQHQQKQVKIQTSTIKNQIWSLQDSAKLFQYHKIFGNKWAKISQLFGDRSDNCVKNHFYSTLRKAHRIINKFIKKNRKKITFGLIKDSVLSKIICLCEKQVFEKDLLNLVDKSKQIVSKLVIIAQSSGQDISFQFMELIVRNLFQINKNFKLKKSQKKKRNSAQNSLKTIVSEEKDEKQLKYDCKQTVQSICASKKQEEIKQGFKLFSSPSFVEQKSVQQNNYLNAQPLPSLNNYCWPYNDKHQFFIHPIQYNQTITVPLFCSPFWNYSRI